MDAIMTSRRSRTARSRRARASALLALLLAGPLLTAGCVGITTADVIVAASAPKAASGMTLFMALQPGVVDRLSDTQRAEYTIYYGDKVVYPLGGKGATFTFQGRSGSVFVPYNLFVEGNGDYSVVLRHDGDEYRTRVGIHKWANYVFVHPSDKGSVIRVEAALGSGTGAAPETRVLTKGELVVDVVYRGLDGKEQRPLNRVRVPTDHTDTSTRVDIPRSYLSAGPGYYSFEPLFHNAEAKNNVQVKADPTMANRNPPWNWIYITR